MSFAWGARARGRTDGDGIMPRAEQQLGTPIPDRDDDFIAVPQRLQRRLVHAREAEIANLDDAAGIDEDVGRFQVPMDDAVCVQVGRAEEELMQEGFERREGDGDAERLVVVMDDLLCGRGARHVGW